MTEPFKNSMPSVFVISSPFQALCAISSIKQLKIVDFLILVVVPKNGSRNDQIYDLLINFGIEFTKLEVNTFFTIIKYIFTCLFKKNNYSRLFLGDYRNPLLFYVGCSYIKKGSSVVYLDDGNTTLSLLLNMQIERMHKVHEMLIDTISTYNRLCLYKNLLTIYEGIHNRKYNIQILHLDSLKVTHINQIRPNKIYLVGTNSQRYCERVGISEAEFYNRFAELLELIRQEYPSDYICFVPHGKDKSCYAQHLLMKYAIDMICPKTIIELLLLEDENAPKAIYGFTSTALYNLKKLFPLARVINVLIYSPDFPDNDFCFYTKYYQQNSIELLKLKSHN